MSIETAATVNLKAAIKLMIRLHGLGLSADEIKTVAHYFESEHRKPTWAEMEMIAQAWSEHTRHKTLRGSFEWRVARGELKGKSSAQPATRNPQPETRSYRNLLKETIFEATKILKKPWVLSAFDDNAGVIALDDEWGVAIKVETHNHPSALHPYGGAATGIGGVIRDILGTGLGAHPIASLDAFCVAPGETAILDGLAAGVRDYGNRMGIPTVAGLVYFDEGFRGLPLVFAGTVGLIRRDHVLKRGPHPGDIAYLIGSKTGRDGIHGATFSSQKFTGQEDRSVVQIGNPILEKKVWDFMNAARAENLYDSVTDLGAGGIACAIWEMAASATESSKFQVPGSKSEPAARSPQPATILGADISLDNVALKEPGMQGWEILVSESQERMLLSVPPQHEARLRRLLSDFELDFTALGKFTQEPVLKVRRHQDTIVNVSIGFLKKVPKKNFKVEITENKPKIFLPQERKISFSKIHEIGLKLLGHPNIASKERIIRQYDHEVGGRTFIKPFVGRNALSPSDAVALKPLYDSPLGVALGLGWAGQLSRFDPRAMALTAFDEALRNIIAVGGGLIRAAALDNYCAGSTSSQKVLGDLIVTSEALKKASLAYGVPFVSGKDSLNNTASDGKDIPISVLVTMVGVLKNIQKTISVPFKEPGSPIYLVGPQTKSLAGSLAGQWLDFQGACPAPDLLLAPKVMSAMSLVLEQGLVLACHDVSDGGLFVALAEMMLGSKYGASVDFDLKTPDAAWIFNEGPSRFVVEVSLDQEKRFKRGLGKAPFKKIGRTLGKPVLNWGSIFWKREALLRAFSETGNEN
ncbi:MAG: phosphoribosylformylglycinamidine synthase [Elusimicrobia bacterium]|nr:phosphoribosylformylglycinamidine synthase [Elusimicrobiota bacterium]